MKSILALLFLFIGCNRASIKQDIPAPSGKLLFSVEVVSVALRDQPVKKNGYFFYLDSNPTLTIYEYQQGSIVMRSSLGSTETSRLLEKLNQISFEELNLDKEIEKVRESWAENDIPIKVIATMDGAEYKIQYIYKNIDYDLIMWNPKSQIELHAPFNSKIEKLRAVISLFAETYGHSQFGI